MEQTKTISCVLIFVYGFENPYLFQRFSCLPFDLKVLVHHFAAYHMKCIDPWLTKNKRNCPVCKRKIALGDGDRASSDSESDEDDGSGERDPAGENTPLLGASGGGAGPAPGTSRGGNTFTDSGEIRAESQPTRVSRNHSESPSHVSWCFHV